MASRSFEFEDVVEALVTEHGAQRVTVGTDYVKAPCLHPDHDDKNPSMSVSKGDNSRTLVRCHAGCDQKELFDALLAFMSGRRSSPSVEGFDAAGECTLDGYAKAKGLPVGFLASLGIEEQKYRGKRRLCMPYGDEAVRYRVALNGPERFRWRSGSKPRLYGLMHDFDSDYVVLVEGESCAQTLWHHDFPAFGLPGTSGWKEERDAQHLERFERVYLVVEPDAAGAKLRDKLAASPSLRGRLHLVDLDPHKDSSDSYLSDPATFRERFSVALEQAEPWEAVMEEKRAARAEAAGDRCADLARQLRILDRFIEDARRAGLVGEEKTACLLYLAVTSRLFQRPASVIVKGPSSGGKSFVVGQVLLFFPPKAYCLLSAMSERALIYWSEEMVHRFLVLYEAAALDSDLVAYMVRSLLSEGEIRYVTVESTPEGIQDREIVRPGPTGLILTTTRISIHPENETRMLSLTVKDDPAQTRAVMRATARGHDETPDLGVWLALQEWLAALDEPEPRIPYADALAEAIPPVAIRLRRDFSTLLTLIRAHALLHRETRERDKDGRIIASLEDYEVVRDLFAETLAEELGVAVSDETRAVVETVTAIIDESRSAQTDKQAGARILTEERAGVSHTQIARRLGLDQSTAWRRVQQALAGGYLKNLETRPRAKARLVLGDVALDEQAVLPPKEALQ